MTRLVRDASGRYHRPDGRFASARAIAAEKRRQATARAEREAQRRREREYAKRSAAAKKGAESRRRKAAERTERLRELGLRRAQIPEFLGAWRQRVEQARFEREEREAIAQIPPLRRPLPERFVPTETELAWKIDHFPRVREAFERGLAHAKARAMLDEANRMQREAEAIVANAQAILAGLTPKEPEPLPEETLYMRLSKTRGAEDLDALIERIAAEGEHSSRELYSLFFSPDAA
jgi:hypothetical protein